MNAREDARVKVLIVEDDTQIRRFVSTALESEGMEVHEASTGSQGLTDAGRLKPDLLILDLGLPDMDGVDVVKRLREKSPVPIIVLSARSLETAKIATLDAGADDYLTKPFSVGELLARVRAAVRRAHGLSGGERREFSLGELKVDLVKRRVTNADKEVHLTPIEYRLLEALVRNAGKVMTHQQLLREVWGPEHAEDNHYIRIYMAQLRHKLEEDPARPRFLLTETGVGYRLADPD
ncbi:MAG TPA: response regulator [Gammaproteobacteria bacterium]|nr:response regulator [Gammaproteobacteria bacterium]